MWAGRHRRRPFLPRAQQEIAARFQGTRRFQNQVGNIAVTGDKGADAGARFLGKTRAEIDVIADIIYAPHQALQGDGRRITGKIELARVIRKIAEAKNWDTRHKLPRL